MTCILPHSEGCRFAFHACLQGLAADFLRPLDGPSLSSPEYYGRSFGHIDLKMELYLYRGGEQVGPYTKDEILLWVSQGDLSEEDIVWHEGMSQWESIRSVLQLRPVELPEPRIHSKTPKGAVLRGKKRANLITKIIRVAGCLAVAILVGAYFASPYLNLYHLKTVVESKDAIKLADHVDFPSLRENLKSSFQEELMKQADEQDADGFAALGAAFGSIMIGPIIDSLVTPEGLLLLLEGKNLLEVGGAGDPEGLEEIADNSSVSEGEADSSMKFRLTEMTYEKSNRFVVSATNDLMISQGKDPISLVFERKGLFSWKLTGIRMSLE